MNGWVSLQSFIPWLLVVVPAMQVPAVKWRATCCLPMLLCWLGGLAWPAFSIAQENRVRGIKGLQVEWVEDALELGIQHSTLNVNLAQLIQVRPDSASEPIPYQRGDRVFNFRRSYVEMLDRKIKRMSEAGVAVNLILLVYRNEDPEVNRILLHPKYNEQAPNRLSAFNFQTEEGASWFRSTLQFLAQRYSRKDHRYGKVAGYIVGNEVNSHWWWSNQGETEWKAFTWSYCQVLRAAFEAVRTHDENAKVFVSLDHHWSRGIDPRQPNRCFGSRAFLDELNRLTKAGGDFSWHVAFHPYPENLFQPRFWQDKSATFDFDTEKVTFKNLEVLTTYLAQERLQFNGSPRRVILSEQGFHTPDGAMGEKIQAAAFCLAYAKVQKMDGVDAFILHRHIDHPREGGLRLGLRWYRPGEADPRPKKTIYDFFRAAGARDQALKFRTAREWIGDDIWNDVLNIRSNIN